MIRTRVGYSGGEKINPTYYDLGEHSETVQIDYDPTRITYEELLDVFWDSHHPIIQSRSRQYWSIIFYHNEEQQRLAEESKKREVAKLPDETIYTHIFPASEFYLAEAYHQKYYLQYAPDLVQEYRTIYPADEDFIASTAVARVNGYVSGFGTLETLKEELSTLGLSPAGQEKLLGIVSKQ